MTVETSNTYDADLKAKRLFNRMLTSVTELSREVENVLTHANAIKLTVASTALTLAEIEALYVNQTHEKRKADSMLYHAQERLTDTLEQLKTSLSSATKEMLTNDAKVEKVFKQSVRVATEPYIDDKIDGPIKGIDYVEMSYFAQELGLANKTIRKFLASGKLPAPDTTSTKQTAGRPSQLWIKSKARNAVLNLQAEQRIMGKLAATA